MEPSDVDACMQYVRNKGFVIEDFGLTSGARRFFISNKKGSRSVFLDIDEPMWNDLSQDGLLASINQAMDNRKSRKKKR